MGKPTVVEVLNRLLSCEQRLSAGRFLGSRLFVPPAASAELSALERIAAESREHVEWLTGLLVELGGAPDPRPVVNILSTDLHYQDLTDVLPRMKADRKALAEQYSEALSLLADEPDAAALVSRILARHQAE